MLKLSTSYSKKIPIPEQQFSSQSFHASVEVELSDALTPEQVQERIHHTFALVKDAVEAELKGNGASVPVAPAPTVVPGKPAQNGDHPVGKASNRQLKFVMDLASQQGFELSALTAHVRKLYGVQSVYDLDKKQASALLDSLQQKKAA